MEYSHTSTSSLSKLLCQEGKSCLDEDEDKKGNNQFEFPKSQEFKSCDFEYEDDDDCINFMVQKETIFGSNYFGSSSSSYSKCSNWLKDSRLDAIHWILNTQTQMGFRNQTAYLSITYFDVFLSLTHIDEGKLWAIRLLSVACLSLAAKMEESKFPSLSEYPIEDYNFDCQVIQRMELLVLSTLGWKMSLITPFDYINYFIGKLCHDQEIKLVELIPRTMELIMAMLKEINLRDYRPSVVAAVAVLAATDWKLTKEALNLKMSSVSLWETSENQKQEQERLFSCYSIMQRLLSSNDNLSTPELTEVHRSSYATTSILGAKRRLTFTDHDRNSNVAEKINRLDDA